MKKMRLDVFISDKGLAKSRTEAKNFISEGAVLVNGKPITKPSYEVDAERDDVTVDKSSKKYVSRGGLKLEWALDNFNINPFGKDAIDIGASSGGFTDCLLQRGANRVVAVDSGTGQLDSIIEKDSRVISYEKFNAKLMTPDMLPFIPNLAVMDVSFISARLIIPAVYACLSNESDYICLIKPQFEVGRAGIGKGGIVKDEKIRSRAVAEVIEFAKQTGFAYCGITESPVKGGDGNTEFLAYFRKGAENEKYHSDSESQKG